MKKAFTYLAVILFFPFFLILCAIALIGDALKEPGKRKRYRASAYCRDLGVPYRSWIVESSAAYRFYNEAKAKGYDFRMIHGKDELDILIAGGDAYWLSEDEIRYDDEASEWRILSDEEEAPLLAVWETRRAEAGPLLPPGAGIRLLLERDRLLPRREKGSDGDADGTEDRAEELLPSFVTLFSDCGDFFKTHGRS